MLEERSLHPRTRKSQESASIVEEKDHLIAQCPYNSDNDDDNDKKKSKKKDKKEKKEKNVTLKKKGNSYVST